MDAATQDQAAPAIGDAFAGGIYAGLTVYNNIPMRLILMAEPCDGTWKSASAKAKKLEAELPTRIDLLVMWNNIPTAFEKDWYWSCEEYASVAESAWYQGFGYGHQTSLHKDFKLRARAVRRLPL